MKVNPKTCPGEKLRDWGWENYPTAFVIGTGAIALGTHLLAGRRHPGRTLLGWAATLAVGGLLWPCVEPQSCRVGPALWRGRDDVPHVALTFDDGPWHPYTEQILDILKSERAPASFFVVGRQVRMYPELVRRMDREGHLVGNHTDNHRNLLVCTPGVSQAEILGGRRALQEVLGEVPGWFRPPFGMRTPWTLKQVREAGQKTALWSNCPRDWQRPGAGTITARVLDKVAPGHIVLLHDGNGDRSQTVGALPDLIHGVRERGFQLVRVDDLIPSH